MCTTTRYCSKACCARKTCLSLQARFISIIVDGSTDSSVTEQELVYVRSCSGGVISNNFVALVPTEVADAKGIFNAILKAAHTELELDEDALFKKTVGLGSDGANVMMGKNNGVAALMKCKQPCLQAVHCSAHRLELAFGDCVKKSRFEKVTLLLLHLYLFYQKSPRKRSLLRRTCEALGCKYLVPSRVGGTRWLPHMKRALQNLWVVYPALVQHFLHASIL